MISIDFSWAIAFYGILFLGGILAAWLSAREEKGKGLSLDPKFIWFCSVCTYNYINTAEGNISVCPRCGSYNKK
jgi:rubrerythrin